MEDNPEMLIDPREFAESDSESEASDDREEAPALVSRDNTLWSENIPGPRKFMKHNVLKYKNTGPPKLLRTSMRKAYLSCYFPKIWSPLLSGRQTESARLCSLILKKKICSQAQRFTPS